MALAGCRARGRALAQRDAGAAPRASSSAVAAPGTMTMSVDGREVPVAHALAATHGGEAVTVWISDGPITCEGARRDGFGTRSDQLLARFVVARYLARRAEEGPPDDARDATFLAISAHWFTGLASEGLGTPPAAVDMSEGAAMNGRKTRIRLDYAAASNGSRFGAHGETELLGCGEARASEIARRPQEDLELKVGDERVVIRGAKITGSPTHRQLDLSTGPLDCGRVIPHRDLALLLPVAGEKGAQRPGFHHVWVSGDRIPDRNGGLDAAGLSIVADGPLDGEGTVGLVVSGSVRSTFDRPVTLRGRVEALLCPPLD